jgi:hypothetical protein
MKYDLQEERLHGQERTEWTISSDRTEFLDKKSWQRFFHHALSASNQTANEMRSNENVVGNLLTST